MCAVNRRDELLSYLRANPKRWVTANELAEFAKVTTRSIRNIIAKIKQQSPGAIESSNQGYRCHATPKTRPDVGRSARLFLLLLKNSDSGMDLYELAAKLFVSQSTLKNALQELRRMLPGDSLNIEVRDGQVHLRGSEQAKRRYMISLLYDEGDVKALLKLSVKNMIGDIPLGELEDTIQSSLRRHGITLNAYALYNNAIHLAVSIERIRQGHVIGTANRINDIAKTKAYALSGEIAEDISRRYGIQFDDAEKEYNALLYIGIESNDNAPKMLGTYVRPEILDALTQVVRDTQDTYHIDLGDKEFFTQLAIHVQRLYYRSQYDTFARNNGILDVKSTYPVIYDISVYMASLLQDLLNIRFNDDEISFIALHVGALLESQHYTGSTIRVALIAENYHTIDQLVKERLESSLGKDVVIIDPDSEGGCAYDILITTNRQVASRQSGSVFVHPLPTQSDMVRAEKRLLARRKQARNQQIYDYIDRFITKDLYFNQVDSADLTPTELRKQMVSRMMRHHYVAEGYLASVEKREQLSPTSFPSGVAVPHSITLNAKISGVSIMTLQEPLAWSDYMVGLVVLTAIEPAEFQAYNTFFEEFIDVLSKPVNTKILGEAEGFDQFILKLKTMIGADDEG